MSCVNNVNNNLPKRRKRRKIFIRQKKPVMYTKSYEMIDRLEIIIETEYVLINDHARDSLEMVNKDNETKEKTML